MLELYIHEVSIRSVSEVAGLYAALEQHMETRHGVRLVARNPRVFVKHRDLFIDALTKNRLPYSFYIQKRQNYDGSVCYDVRSEISAKYLIDLF